MGLLSRLAGAGRRAMPSSDTLNMMAANTTMGGLIGAGLDGRIGDDGIGNGALGGAALGAGLGMAGTSRSLMRALAQGWREGGAKSLDAVKREAMDGVPNRPQAQQAVMQAQSADEISMIVDDVVSRSRVRGMEGGY